MYAVQLKEADFDRILASAQTALNEDANFYGQSASLHRHMSTALQTYTAATENFIKVVQDLSDSSTPSITADAYLSAGQKARDESFALWHTAVTELDVLIQQRIEHYTHSRTMALLLTTLAVMASIVLLPR